MIENFTRVAVGSAMRVAVLLPVALFFGCASEPPASCGAIGRVESCACPGGAQGAQECGPAGVWTACVCPGADAGPEAGDASAPPVDGPTAPDAVADGPGAAADVPAPPDGPPEAAVDVAPDASPLVCSAPMADCDGVASNGCEVDTRASPLHCGQCGRPCAAPRECTNGICGRICVGSLADCDADPTYCEADLATNPLHCGACGNRCPTGTQCRVGRCV